MGKNVACYEPKETKRGEINVYSLVKYFVCNICGVENCSLEQFNIIYITPMFLVLAFQSHKMNLNRHWPGWLLRYYLTMKKPHE